MGYSDYFDFNGNRVQFCFDFMDNVEVQIERRDKYSGNFARLGSFKAYSRLLLRFTASNGKIHVGEAGPCVTARLTVGMNGGISVGDDCMLASEVTLDQFDAHHIFDLESGKRLNRGKDISVGNQVWLGRSVSLLGERLSEIIQLSELMRLLLVVLVRISFWQATQHKRFEGMSFGREIRSRTSTTLISRRRVMLQH